MFYVFSEITNNKYHYNLLTDVKYNFVKTNFNFGFFYKIRFNLTKIVFIDQIYYNNIDYNFMKILFNFNKLKKLWFF